MAALNLVAAIVSAYQEGSELLFSIKERKWAHCTTQAFETEARLMQDLEFSLERGADVIQTEYERDSKRFGANFASGDRKWWQLSTDSIPAFYFADIEAEDEVDTLNDIVIYMQKRLISSLKIAWQQDTHVDYLRLQDVSDDAQDRALMCLMQFHQRLLVAHPFDRSKVPHPSRPGHTSRPSQGSGPPKTYIDPPPPRASGFQPFGTQVTASEPVSNSSKYTRPRQGSQRSRDSQMASGPRIQHIPSVTSDFIPIEFHHDNSFYNLHQQDQYQEHGDSSKSYNADQRFADSPTIAPQRIDSIGSLSSYGSHDPDDPEFNPWSTSGAGSPISSFNGSASPGHRSPQTPALVPDALSPRRQDGEREYHRSHQEASLDESLHSMSIHSSQPRNVNNAQPRHVVSQYRAPPNMASALNSTFLDNDDSSVYSRDTDSNTPSYPHQGSAGESSHLDSYFPSPPTHGARRVPTYNLFPSQNPAREIMRSPPPPQRSLQARLPPFQQSTIPPPSIPLPKAPSREQSHSPIPAHKWVGPRAAPTAPLPPTPDQGFERPPERRHISAYERPHERLPERNLDRFERAPEPIPERSPDRIAIPERIPERAPARLTAMTMTSTSSGGSSAAMTAASQTPLSTHNSFHLTTKRVSTVSSSNSSTYGTKAMPALKVIPSTGTVGNVKSCLPSEANKFAGFCKGAWRGQIGDKKKAYEERSRPAGISTNKVFNFYKCRKCNFEGRAVKLPGEKKSLPDSKVYGANGILYRWEFLFKSHLDVKTPHQNPIDATYGCMFCCAQGRGTPVFNGVASLLAHLQEHRETLPEGEIVYRMNAIVGRSPDIEEDFDIALPSLVV